tara:strand:+ start:233 stop:364 length:132 start_codon:yes stop_codon:yes gene_type:complete
VSRLARRIAVEPVTVTKKEEESAQQYIKKNFNFDINDINHFID